MNAIPWKFLSQTTLVRSIGRGFGAALTSIGLALMLLVSPGAQAADKTITIAVEGEPTRLDPHTHALWLTYRVVYHLYEGLVQQDLSRDDVELPPIIPALAESWELSEDQKTYTFNLRKGVTFR